MARAAEQRIGRYVLHGVIASGGMARVHLGRLLGEAGFSRTVAIKRLRSEFAEDPDFASSLIDEARIAARIRHPHVVPTLDVLALGGELLVVMEYVAGESLAQLLRLARERDRRVPVRVATAVVAGALEGLHAAHEATNELGEPLGIVHRDVSPHNVLVGADGLARVLDFGVAKARGRASSTGAGQIKGKVAYMSPEQILCGDVDRRTDVYAACVVLWEALTGRRALQADDEGALIGRALAGIDDAPSSVAPDVPPALDALVMRGLAKDPAARFASARDLARALEDEVGVASPRQVADWVADLAGAELEARAAEVAAIERGDGATRLGEAASSASEPADTDVTATGSAPTAREQLGATASQVSSVSVSARAISRERPPQRRGWLAAVALLGVLGGGAAFVRLGGLDEPAAPAGAATEGVAATAPAPPAATNPAAPETAASPRATVSAAPAAAASSAAHVGTAARSGPGGAAPSGSARAAPSGARPGAPTRAGCDPPYTTDARGIRRLRPECL